MAIEKRRNQQKYKARKALTKKMEKEKRNNERRRGIEIRRVRKKARFLQAFEVAFILFSLISV